MRPFNTISICILAATLAACSSDSREQMGAMPSSEQAQMAAQDRRDCSDSITAGVEVSTSPAVAMFIKLRGKDAREVLANGAELETEIDTVGGRGRNLYQKIYSVQRGPKTQGFAGISTEIFVEAAKATTDQRDYVGPVDLTMSGKIIAYYYNEATEEGCLKVVTTADWRRGSEVGSLTYRWTVFVAPGGFKVNRRISPPDPNDVFGTGADTIAIPASLADMHMFQSKLWAKGLTIHVEKVERLLPNGNWHVLGSGHPLYQVTDESCIDMMFQATTPPATLPPGTTPPFYCLGRCDHPPLINTM